MDEKAMIRVNGRFIRAEAVLVDVRGGKAVVYMDAKGKELKREPLCRSPYKDILYEHVYDK